MCLYKWSNIKIGIRSNEVCREIAATATAIVINKLLRLIIPITIAKIEV